MFLDENVHNNVISVLAFSSFISFNLHTASFHLTIEFIVILFIFSKLYLCNLMTLIELGYFAVSYFESILFRKKI